MTTSASAVREIQRILLVAEDGIAGPRTRAALDLLFDAELTAPWPPDDNGLEGEDTTEHKVRASSFADPADITAFQKCKDTGKTDLQCFRVGDNGIGKWGDSTIEGSGPSVALPPEDWARFGVSARNRKVRVRVKALEVVCFLRDTMPAKKNIKNGAGIDLNPDAAAALGLKPPFMVDATWSWV